VNGIAGRKGFNAHTHVKVASAGTVGEVETVGVIPNVGARRDNGQTVSGYVGRACQAWKDSPSAACRP
jgi:hypothetical protein